MEKGILQTGFFAGIVAFTATLAFFIVQLLQILRILNYPWDEILIYGFSLLITLPFLLEMLALHYTAPADKKYWSHAALIFSSLYVVFVTANYVVQLGTVIPMTLRGNAQEIRILAQTPHSLFWNYDAAGYIFMGLATMFALPIFEKHGFQNAVRIIFLAHGLVTPLIAFVYFYPGFSEKILLLGLPWGITAPASMLALALLFRKKLRNYN